MFKNIFLLLSVFGLSFCAYENTNAQDMQKYLQDTRELVNKKNYKEALDREIWFQDHALEFDKAMTGVRLSFALSDWKSLADIYLPALTAMIEMRDKKTNELINKGNPISLFQDISALNRTLGEGFKTIDLFETITKKYPNESKSCWIYAKDILFSAKRYNIIRNYIGTPILEFNVVKENYNRDTTFYNNPKMNGAHFKLFNENRFVENTLQLIDFSIANKDISSAKEIQKQAMKVVKDYRLQNAIRG